MKKVLITGGNGDIAQAIKNKLSAFCDVYTPSKNELDVTDLDSIITYIRACQPDILINCAGYIEPSSIINTTWTNFMKHINTNLVGAFECAKHALIIKPQCIIINIGSSAGLHGKKDWSAYCASKAALISLTESMHEEGFKAICISLSRTKTKMRYRLYGDEDEETLVLPSEVAILIEWILAYPDRYYGKNLLIKKGEDGCTILI